MVRLEKRQDGSLVEEDRTEDSVLSNPVLSAASPSHPGKNIWPFLDHFLRSKSRLMQIVHFLFFFFFFNEAKIKEDEDEDDLERLQRWAKDFL